MDTVGEVIQRNTIVIRDPALRNGFTVVPNLVFGVRGLSHGARLTYVLLLKYAWREGSCYPGVGRLAEDLEVERKSVMRYTRELVARGLITVKRRGLSMTNIYYVNRLPGTLAANGDIEAEVPSVGLQEVPPIGPTEVPSMGHKEDSGKKIQNAVKDVVYQAKKRAIGNSYSTRQRKLPGQVEYLTDEILQILGDEKFRPYYEHVARSLPDDAVFRFLSEIKADSNVRNRGAVFTSKVKEYVKRKGGHG